MSFEQVFCTEFTLCGLAIAVTSLRCVDGFRTVWPVPPSLRCVMKRACLTVQGVTCRRRGPEALRALQ